MSHIEKKEFEIYRITPPPPEWDLQEYIRQYIQTGAGVAAMAARGAQSE